MLYQFFLVRKIVAHISSYYFFCLVIPATVLVPEVRVPVWGAVYAPSIITLLNAAACLRCVVVPEQYPPASATLLLLSLTDLCGFQELFYSIMS